MFFYGSQLKVDSGRSPSGIDPAVLAPSSLRAHALQARTCLSSSWLNPLRVLSLRKTRGDSNIQIDKPSSTLLPIPKF